MAKARTKSTKRQPRHAAPLVYRGVVIRPPHVAPDTPLAKIRRGAKVAVRRYFDELAAAE
jgi:hypothetical protein